MRWLLDYTAQQSSGIAAWQRDTDHIEKAFVFGGMPARSGVTSALLVRSGWTGVDDILSGPDNFFLANAPNADPARLIEKLGERYEIIRTNIKKWSVGSPIQAPLDALEILLQATSVRRRARCERSWCGSAPAKPSVVNNRDIPDICLQHMVAVMLIDGPSRSWRPMTSRACATPRCCGSAPRWSSCPTRSSNAGCARRSCVSR